jgi:2-polyprenyl-3-methyl-5-hydroxy-6-metoxy-1,4-benzoquinol methylase
VRAFDRLVTGEGPFEVMECPACEYGVTVPELGEDELSRFYPDQYYEDFYEHSDGEDHLLHRLRERYRRRSAGRRYRRPPFQGDELAAGRILDVGCGSGELLEHFADSGWRGYGIDPSPAAVESARRRGAEAHHGTLVDQPWPAGFFDLITFQHSLEHIVDPVDALRRARMLLVPGGLLAIEVPNWDCWQRRLLFRNRWFGLDLPRHRQHFSPQALDRLGGALDLNVRALGTSSTAISTAYSLHYLIAGRWSPGWKLWLSYALSLPLLPFVWLGDRIGGGDCCYVLMERKAAEES